MSANPSVAEQAEALALRSTLRIGDVAEFRQECEAWLSTHSDQLVCDASVIEFVDAAALQYLVALRRHCVSLGRSFEIRKPSAAFASAAQVSGYALPLGLAAD